MRARRYLLAGLAALYFAGLILVTFLAEFSFVRAFWPWPFIAFMPVGAILLLMVGAHRWWVAVGFAVLGAAWIEAAQSVWMPEGYARMGDIVLGSAGAIIGVAAAAGILSRRNATRSPEPHGIVAHSGNRHISQD